MMIACNRAVIELSDNSRKSLCNGQSLAMGADTNLLSSIGCGEECRRRCLVSVVGVCFVGQCACFACVCVFSFLIYCYVFVGTCSTDTVAKPPNVAKADAKPAADFLKLLVYVEIQFPLFLISLLDGYSVQNKEIFHVCFCRFVPYVCTIFFFLFCLTIPISDYN